MVTKPKYNPKDYEEKWSKKWLETKLYKKPEIKKGDKKFYSLYSFPYPSGAGLHVGHVEGMVANDISARFNRMNGAASFLPMGWDSFGLPAENYAIKTGRHPKDTTEEAISTFIGQINKIGIGVDWDSEVGAHTPEYYKWTQWIFIKMFEKGVAYKANAPVNWCDSCQTVLANEQVIDGKCERCGNTVVQKEMNQWFYKITDYADRLVNGLDTVDWPNSTKAQQLNWIGKSEGAEIKFKVNSEKLKVEIPVFTTRPDTIFGATFLVLAPEHPLVHEYLSLCHSEQSEESIKKANEIREYIDKSKHETELQRQQNKEKTGVDLGISVINPANGEELPVFISDYILMGYGTGAIMAVPAHDERDYEFAKKFNLPIKVVIEGSNSDLPYVGDGKIINSAYLNGLYASLDKNIILESLSSKIGIARKTTYRLRDWLLSRQRYWGAPIPVVYDPDGKAHAVKEEHLPWMLPTDVDFIPKGYSPLSRSEELLQRTEKLYGKGWKPEVDTMDTFVDSSWYFFRQLDPKNNKEFVNKELADNWLPTDLYMIGAEHIVLHLLYARFFTKFLFDEGFISFEEPFMKMRHMGIILGPDGRKMSKRWGNVINPTDVVASYGADAVRMYEMFMAPLELEKPWNDNAIAGVYRFLNKVWDLMNGGFTQTTSYQLNTKLHKTIKKVEDDIQDLKFNTAISAMMEFVNEWQALSIKNADSIVKDLPICIVSDKEHLNATINNYKQSALYKDKQEKLQDEMVNKTSVLSKLDAYNFLQILAPFAPFLTEELNSSVFNNKTSIHLSKWPKYIESFLVAQNITIPIQINGKVRGELQISNNELQNKEEVIKSAKGVIDRYLEGVEIKKEIYIPGKIINFVI